ncbi:MAG: hypothetical protein MZU95_15645 [Desulfomicrobium escambiense]|nr:hypothetical protein [Desulfomicrobium escambiense]
MDDRGQRDPAPGAAQGRAADAGPPAAGSTCPGSRKMSPPAYGDLPKERIPVVEE